MSADSRGKLRLQELKSQLFLCLHRPKYTHQASIQQAGCPSFFVPYCHLWDGQMPSDAAPDRPKFPQLQWQLPETSSYAPEAFETLVHINPDQSQSSTPAKASSSGQAPTRMPQTKREERQRPQTSGQLRASSRQAATRAPQRWSDSGNPGSEQVQKAGGAPKLEWALPPALSPVKAIKGGQRLASKLLSAKQATASKGEAAPSGGLANSGGRRISASVSTGSAPSSASQSAGSADTGKWSAPCLMGLEPLHPLS